MSRKFTGSAYTNYLRGLRPVVRPLRESLHALVFAATASTALSAAYCIVVAVVALGGSVKALIKSQRVFFVQTLTAADDFLNERAACYRQRGCQVLVSHARATLDIVRERPKRLVDALAALAFAAIGTYVVLIPSAIAALSALSMLHG